MKPSVFHKVSSVSLALLVLISTVSFTVEKHYCGDTLVDVALFTNAESCGMEMPNMMTANDRKSCCTDEVNVIEGQDELNLSFQDLDLDQQQFIAAFFKSYINLFESLPNQIIPFKDYSPPNLVINIQLVNDVFLI